MKNCNTEMVVATISISFIPRYRENDKHWREHSRAFPLRISISDQSHNNTT